MSEDSIQLRVSRRKSGLTQRDFAHLLGVKKTTVSELETGKSRPKLRDAFLLAAIYGKPVESLLPGSADEARRLLMSRLPTLPDCPRRWLGRFNRQNTLNELASRLEGLIDRRA